MFGNNLFSFLLKLILESVIKYTYTFEKIRKSQPTLDQIHPTHESPTTINLSLETHPPYSSKTHTH